MRFLKVIIVVLTISFSAFLINRSCHDNPGVDPDTSGGISQIIRKEESERLSTASSSAPSPEASSIESTEKVEAAVPLDSMPLTGTKQEYSKGSTRIAGTEEAARKLRGNWVLTDGSTTLQLTVVNKTGSLKGEISDAGRSVRIEQEAFLLGGDNTVYVYGSKPNDTSGYDRIFLAFYFKEDGSAQVVWMRQNKSIPLRVVSYVR